MTPKTKAIKMFDKYMEITNNYYQAKECALIAVDELIKYHDDLMDVVRYELPSNIVAVIPYKYWEEVKQEIEAL
jgi:hypothetical protein